MSVKTNIKIDTRQVDKLLAAWPKARRRVLRRAASKAAASMQTHGRREVRQITKLAGKFVNPLVQKYRPSSTDIALGYVNPAPIVSVYKLVHSQTASGVDFIAADKSKQRIAHAFRSEKLKGVFKRKGKDRYPIVKQYYRRDADTLDESQRSRVAGIMRDTGRKVYVDEITRLTQLELDKAVQ